jgi:membrane protein implicated in regulation of membrane protease activity
VQVLRLAALVALDVVLFLWWGFAAAAENNDSWTTSEAVQIATFLLFVAVFIALWVLVGVQIGQRREAKRQRR